MSRKACHLLTNMETGRVRGQAHRSRGSMKTTCYTTTQVRQIGNADDGAGAAMRLAKKDGLTQVVNVPEMGLTFLEEGGGSEGTRV